VLVENNSYLVNIFVTEMIVSARDITVDKIGKMILALALENTGNEYINELLYIYMYIYIYIVYVCVYTIYYFYTL